MTTETEKGKELGPWELESGLISDVDAWIANAHFGEKDEYKSKVMATETDQTSGLMFMFDFIGENGEILGSQGYSVGTGWIPSDDGMEITHPKRNNVVRGSRYADLQDRVVKDLGVDMMSRGLPTNAKVWNGLGFHWMLEDHATVGGDVKQGIMPTIFLGEKDVTGAPAAGTAKAPVKATVKVATDTTAVDKVLGLLVDAAADAKAFQIEAVKVSAVTQDDALMASVFDDGPEGYFATHKK